MARRKDHNYMIRSEKRPGFKSPEIRAPKTKAKKGVAYKLLTLLSLVIVYPAGLIMLWLRKIKWRGSIKLLVSVFTGACFFLLSTFLMTVPVEDTRIQNMQASGKQLVFQIYDSGAEFANWAMDGIVHTTLTAKDSIVSGAGYVGNRIQTFVKNIGATPTPTEKAITTPDNTENPDTPATATNETTTEAAGTTQPQTEKTTKETKVWVAGDSSFYHSKSDCEGLSGAHQITLLQAAQQGLIPCNRCKPVDYPAEWSQGNDNEKQATQAPVKAILITPAANSQVTSAPVQATTPPTKAPTKASTTDAAATTDIPASEKDTLAPTEVPKNTPVPATPQPTETPTPTATPVVPTPAVPKPDTTPEPIGQMLVWHSLPGKGRSYHVDENCSGMYGAKQYTLESSIADGFRACGVCNPPQAELLKSELVIWMDSSKSFHVLSNCEQSSGKQTPADIADALKQGATPCSKCGADYYAQQWQAGTLNKVTDTTTDAAITPTPAPTAKERSEKNSATPLPTPLATEKPKAND